MITGGAGNLYEPGCSWNWFLVQCWRTYWRCEEKKTRPHTPAPVEGDGSAAKHAKIKILSPRLISALDRTKFSSRNATFVLSEVAPSLGHDVSTLNINSKSIDRARASHKANRSSNGLPVALRLTPVTHSALFLSSLKTTLFDRGWAGSGPE